mmetsp:Transcript_25677/g.66091  ORF Transcript_25677/g.66091 Transcript_25677/m.66091 type:complete len:84 (+) Transcript_25677:280-531(+)
MHLLKRVKRHDAAVSKVARNIQCMGVSRWKWVSGFMALRSLRFTFPKRTSFQNAEFFPYCSAYDSSASAQTIAYTPTYVVKIT